MCFLLFFRYHTPHYYDKPCKFIFVVFSNYKYCILIEEYDILVDSKLPTRSADFILNDKTYGM
jgi:hypothetical protein